MQLFFVGGGGGGGGVVCIKTMDIQFKHDTVPRVKRVLCLGKETPKTYFIMGWQTAKYSPKSPWMHMTKTSSPCTVVICMISKSVWFLELDEEMTLIADFFLHMTANYRATGK